MLRTSSSPTPYSLLPYSKTTPAQRVQALAYTQQRLQQQFSSFTNERWAALLAEYEPIFWIEDESQTVAVEENSLLGLANWINLCQNADQNEDVPLYNHDAYYLARNIASYSQHAEELLVADPELAKPESIEQMQAVFRRLAAGNSVAERVCRVCQTPVTQNF